MFTNYYSVSCHYNCTTRTDTKQQRISNVKMYNLYLFNWNSARQYVHLTTGKLLLHSCKEKQKHNYRVRWYLNQILIYYLLWRMNQIISTQSSTSSCKIRYKKKLKSKCQNWQQWKLYILYNFNSYAHHLTVV